jgi:hypothetical protein
MATVGTLLIDIAANTAKLQQDMERAKGTVDKAMRGIESAASTARLALGALVGGFSAQALAGQFKLVVDGLDALNDAADKTGASIEKLSGLEAALAPYGHTLASVTDLTGKLVKSMQEADNKTSNAAQAFTALRVAARTADGNLADPVDTIVAIAKALNGYEDGANKAALAQALLGKSGADALPMLKDLASAGQLQARVTTQQAEQAEAFNKQLATLKFESAAAGRAIVSDLLPAMTTLLERLNAAKASGGGLFAWATTSGADEADPVAAAERVSAALERLRKTRDNLAAPGFRNRFNNMLFGDVGDLDRQIAAQEQRLRYLQALSSRAMAGNALAGPAAARQQAPAIIDAEAQKRASEDAEREAQRLRDLDLRGWVAHADAVLREVEDMDRAMATIHDERNREEERLRQEDVRGWVAHADAVLKEAEDNDKALADIAEERQREYERSMSDFQRMLADLAKDADKADRWAKDLGLTFTSAFEDAITKGEKLSVVLQSLVRDIAKLAIRETITKPGGEFVTSLIKAGGTALVSMFGGAGTSQYSMQGGNPDEYFAYQPRAEGGPIAVGRPYLVGERGPELIVPAGSGTVVPNEALGGAVTINISTGVAQTVRAEILRLLPSIQRSVEAGWSARRAQGGGYARA